MSSDDANTKHVPLEEYHRDHGAKMTEFGGFMMPVQFDGITDEHRAVRQNVGLFDVSHMGEVEIRGPEAIRVANGLMTNDVSRLADGQAQYSAMCNEEGGIVDDCVYYRLDAERILVCTNAANRDKDFAHMTEHATGEAELVDRGDDYIQLALQGPNAQELLAGLTDLELDDIKFYRSAFGEVAGVETLVSRTGYTGEDGFELYAPSDRAAELFEPLLEAGESYEMALCGLGARDTLRLEAMLNLYGQDMTEQNNPYEARLGWTVKLDKETPFVGREALRAIKDEGPDKLLRGLVLEGRGVIRPDYDLYLEDRKIGRTTSGSYAPTLEQSIGLGYIDSDFADVSEVAVEIRNRRLPARLTNEPFYKR